MNMNDIKRWSKIPFIIVFWLLKYPYEYSYFNQGIEFIFKSLSVLTIRFQEDFLINKHVYNCSNSILIPGIKRRIAFSSNRRLDHIAALISPTSMKDFQFGASNKTVTFDEGNFIKDSYIYKWLANVGIC